MDIGILHAGRHVSVHAYLHVCVYQCSRSKESTGTGVPDGCEPPCGSWDPTLDPLQNQQVFLRADPRVSLHVAFSVKKGSSHVVHLAFSLVVLFFLNILNAGILGFYHAPGFMVNI